MKALRNRVAFYVPRVNPHFTERLAARLSIRFGGCTIQDATGCYVMGAGNLCTESVQIVYAFGDFAAEDILPGGYFETLAEEIKTALAQEAVAFEVNGTLYLTD